MQYNSKSSMQSMHASSGMQTPNTLAANPANNYQPSNLNATQMKSTMRNQPSHQQQQYGGPYYANQSHMSSPSNHSVSGPVSNQMNSSSSPMQGYDYGTNVSQYQHHSNTYQTTQQHRAMNNAGNNTNNINSYQHSPIPGNPTPPLTPASNIPPYLSPNANEIKSSVNEIKPRASNQRNVVIIT